MNLSAWPPSRRTRRQRGSPNSMRIRRFHYDVLRRLLGENYLIGCEPQRFAQRAGFYMGEINAIHPFRDGNGRAQREFIRALGLQAGFVIEWTKITREQMMAASRDNFATGDNSGLAAQIRLCIK